MPPRSISPTEVNVAAALLSETEKMSLKIGNSALSHFPFFYTPLPLLLTFPACLYTSLVTLIFQSNFGRSVLKMALPSAS